VLWAKEEWQQSQGEEGIWGCNMITSGRGISGERVLGAMITPMTK